MQTLLLTDARTVPINPMSVTIMGMPASIGCAMEPSSHRVQFASTHHTTQPGAGQQVLCWRYVGVSSTGGSSTAATATPDE
jgi:hypothetical protein